jgi:hypothetical protein
MSEKIQTLLVGLVTFVLVLGGAGLGTSSTSAWAPAQQTIAQTITVTTLSERPDQFQNKRVSITADVEDVYSRTMFSLDDDRVWSTGKDVLVINPRPLDRLIDNTSVTVTGTVYAFRRAEIERRLEPWSWDVSPDLVLRFQDRPVLVAESIRVKDSDREFVLAAIDSASPTVRGGVLVPLPISTGELASNPQKYYGKPVLVVADIEDMFSATVFSLDEDKLWSTAKDVLVVAPGLSKNASEEDWVTVVGMVAQFSPAEVERQTPGYRLDLSPKLARDFADRPVIVAKSVRAPDGRELMVSSGW